MKKRLVCVALVAVAVLLPGVLYWLLGTPAGALWLMKAVSARSGIVIEAQRVEGRLWGDLRIQGLRVAWANGRLRSNGLTLQWRPFSLLSGTVSVKRLELDHVTIDDESPGRQGPVDLSWPRVSGLPAVFDAGIDLLTIDRLIYRRLSGSPVEISSLESSIDWHEGTLGISVLHVATGSSQAKGRIAIGLVRPSLSLATTAALSRPVGGIDRITLHAVLSEGMEKDEQVRGRTTFSAMSGKSQIFSLVSDVSVMARSVGIKDLVVVSQGRRGAVRGSGRVDFPGGGPRITMETRIYDLDLSSEARFFPHVSGSLGRGRLVSRDV
jgi:translocation and assembly module TamB